MQVGGVAEQEDPALAPGVGDPLMNAVAGEGLDQRHSQIDIAENFRGDIVEVELGKLLSDRKRHAADEAHAAGSTARKHAEQRIAGQDRMKLSIGQRPGGLYIGHEYDLLRRLPSEIDIRQLPHQGSRPVAAADKRDFADLLRTALPVQPRPDQRPGALEIDEFCIALDLDADPGEVLDQQLFLIVLRQDQDKRKRTEALAKHPERKSLDVVSAPMKAHGRHHAPARQGVLRQAQPAIEFQGAGLQRKGAGRSARSRSAIDDPQANAQPRQPERQHHAAGAGADN